MRLEEIINERRQLLSETDMLIWKYIVKHRQEVRRLSVHELARRCAASAATVVRFAQKLGLDGFGELKTRLRLEEAAAPADTSDVLSALGDFYQQTWERFINLNFDGSIKLISKARRVFAFASGYVQSNVVQELKRLFFYDDVLIYEVAGWEEFRSLTRNLNEHDLFIFVSLSGETNIVVNMARELRLLEVPFISVTKLQDNTLASLSTINLYVSPAKFQLYAEGDSRPSFQSMMPYFFLVETLYVKYRLYLQHLDEAAE